jgi:hypothetical protein
MGITEIIAKFLGIIDKGMALGLVKLERKYIDELVDLKKQLIEEKAKGDLSDDAKIEIIYKRIPILLDAIDRDLDSHASSK